MLPFENFVHCEKELWVHWGERWHNWFNIKFSFFRWNFFMVWWMDQQFLGMWLDSNHHHDRHKKCRREWIDILMQQSVSTLSPSGFVMSTIKLTERGDLQSSETAEQITKKPWYAFATTNQKASLSSGTFYQLTNLQIEKVWKSR